MNGHLRKLVRRENRLHRQARKTKKWNNYRRVFRRAEWAYVNSVIQEGLAQNNT